MSSFFNSESEPADIDLTEDAMRCGANDAILSAFCQLEPILDGASGDDQFLTRPAWLSDYPQTQDRTSSTIGESPSSSSQGSTTAEFESKLTTNTSSTWPIPTRDVQEDTPAVIAVFDWSQLPDHLDMNVPISLDLLHEPPDGGTTFTLSIRGESDQKGITGFPVNNSIVFHVPLSSMIHTLFPQAAKSSCSIKVPLTCWTGGPADRLFAGYLLVVGSVETTVLSLRSDRKNLNYLALVPIVDTGENLSVTVSFALAPEMQSLPLVRSLVHPARATHTITPKDLVASDFALECPVDATILRSGQLAVSFEEIDKHREKMQGSCWVKCLIFRIRRSDDLTHKVLHSCIFLVAISRNNAFTKVRLDKDYEPFLLNPSRSVLKSQQRDILRKLPCQSHPGPLFQQSTVPWHPDGISTASTINILPSLPADTETEPSGFSLAYPSVNSFLSPQFPSNLSSPAPSSSPFTPSQFFESPLPSLTSFPEMDVMCETGQRTPLHATEISFHGNNCRARYSHDIILSKCCPKASAAGLSLKLNVLVRWSQSVSTPRSFELPGSFPSAVPLFVPVSFDAQADSQTQTYVDLSPYCPPRTVAKVSQAFSAALQQQPLDPRVLRCIEMVQRGEFEQAYRECVQL